MEGNEGFLIVMYGDECWCMVVYSGVWLILPVYLWKDVFSGLSVQYSYYGTITDIPLPQGRFMHTIRFASYDSFNCYA